MAKRSLGARVMRGGAFSILGLAVLGAGGLAGLLSAPFPTDATVKDEGSVTLVDARGTPYAAITPPEIKKPLGSLSQVSSCMIKAITAAEDQRFFTHNGVDPFAVVRAAIADITHSGNEQGGSTITEQYVKLVYTGSEKTALRKVRQAALAVRLEQRKSKNEILRLYLNAVNFGNGLVGIQAAATDYFGKDAKDLDCAESALLAGSVNAPSYNNPRYGGGVNAAARAKYVLTRMVVHKDITPQDASDDLAEISCKSDSCKSVGLIPAKDRTRPTDAPEYTDEVVALVRQKLALGDDLFARGAITIKTPLDLDLQEAARKALSTVLPKKSGPDPLTQDPEAAIVAIDPRTGQVRALTTKQDGGYQRGGFDLATQAERNSGSTVKPFTLAAALQSGKYTAGSGLASQTLLTVPGCQPPFKVQNAEPGSGGYYSISSALEQSVNTIYAPLAVDVGLSKVRDEAVAAGIPAHAFEGAPPGCPVYPSQSLGMGRVTPIDLTHGYATLSDSGQRHDLGWITSVTSADTGTTLLDAGNPTGIQAIPKDVADQVVNVMRGVVSRGTGTAARPPGLDVDLYGKTGTTDDFTNAWFVGCNPTLCIGVWMGYNNPTPMRDVEGSGEGFGGTLPAKMFNLTLQNFAANRARHKLPALPSGAAGSFVAPSFVPVPPSTVPTKKAASPTGKGGKASAGTKTSAPVSVAPPSPVTQTTAPPPVVDTSPAAPPPTTAPTSAPASPATLPSP